uniref:Uncharacterized protein n=1 Tax=Rhizophora mucronata TaxID=61149 RepID=A0A2P2IJG3_RHIMU
MPLRRSRETLSPSDAPVILGFLKTKRQDQRSDEIKTLGDKPTERK